MITSILAAAFVFALFYAQIELRLLLLISTATGAFVLHFSRHGHTQFLSTDMLAQMSRLKGVSAVLKFWTLIILIIISVSSNNAYTGAFLTVAAVIFAVFAGGLPLHGYISLMILPVSFLLIGGLALLFEISPVPYGVLNFNVFGFWLSVSEKTQAQASLVVFRALGAVSCLALLSVTTPMPDIIAVLRRLRCPELIIDLMYLIYRYIFILLFLHHEMYDAAKSRLGFRDYRTSIRATGNIYANLLMRSYQFAGKNFDAMESRCYDTGIRFLENRRDIKASQAAVALTFILIAAFISSISI